MIYKFILKPGEWKPIPGTTGLEAQGCVAVVRAASHDDAMRTLIAWCAEEGINSAWVGVAKVIEYPEGPAKVIAYAEV